MASTAVRRNTTASRPPVRGTKPPSTTADQLANDLSKKLVIGNAKGKQKAKEVEPTPQELRLAAMRGVNAASQALAAAVQSGWKKSTQGGSKTGAASITSSATEAAKHLLTLRKMALGDLDVERAAASILGKLMALELLDFASAALSDMHPPLCSIVGVPSETRTDNIHLLAIPLPSTPPTDPVILNLLSTYLVHSIILFLRPESPTAKLVTPLASFLQSSNTGSLLAWIPHLSALPTKQVDATLTRAYTVITKLCSSPPSAPIPTRPTLKPKVTAPAVEPPLESFFLLRSYALRCLVHTSPGVIQSEMFWEQATRFSTILVKTTASSNTKLSEEAVTKLVLQTYDNFVRLVRKRPDRDAFFTVDGDGNGRKFVAFCDHWASFAKRSGDIALLKEINVLMKQPSSSTLMASPVKRTPSAETPNSVGQESSSQPNVLVEGTRLYNHLSQLSVVLEKATKEEVNSDEVIESLHESSTLLRSSNCISYLRAKPSSKDTKTKTEEDAERICAKVERGFERVRRLALKLLETNMSALEQPLRDWLTELVGMLQTVLSDENLTASLARNTLTHVFDTLFVLSRTTLKISDPTSYVPAYDFLAQASSVLTLVPPERFPSTEDEEGVDLSNYTRCVSGAFYNLAGIFYHAARYGNAVPFLVESCKLGEEALIQKASCVIIKDDNREKDWKQLEEQLFRRWELLGACYSKNGDRKNAYDAFKRAIRSFPFASSGLASQCDKVAPDALFGENCSSAVKQLVSLVDRVTYMGACELMLSPQEISLRSTPSLMPDLGSSIEGALLERQLDSLEPSRWKDGVRGVLVALLKDALAVYKDEEGGAKSFMPVRRARVVVKCMEFIYHDAGDDLVEVFGFDGFEDMLEEVEALSSIESFGRDAQLTHFVLQYRIAVHLWIALHTHRSMDPEQNTIMTQHSEQACGLIKALLEREDEPVNAKAKTSALRRTSGAFGTARTKTVVRLSGSPKVARIVSPKTTTVRQTRARNAAAMTGPPPAPRKAAPVRKAPAKRATKATVEPVTPKARTSALQPVAMTKTPPRKSLEPPGPTIVFDNFEKMLALLQLSARILGLLSLILAKAHLLDMTRRLAQRHSGSASDAYVLASLDLAHEYVALGKLKRAASIFNQALDIVRSGQASHNISIRFLLRFAESLAIVEDLPKSATVYLEALQLSLAADVNEKGMSTQERVHARAKALEIAATASHVFALIQHVKGDLCSSLEVLRQSIRLWNRAIDALTRLRPSTTSSTDTDPFEMSSLKNALPSGRQDEAAKEQPKTSKIGSGRAPLDGLEWRLSEGLIATLFTLAQTYYLQGSAREAEYFAQQAIDLTSQLNAPAMVSRALARQGEIQLYMHKFAEAHENLNKAAELLRDMPGLDTADIRRLRVDYYSKRAEKAESDSEDEEDKRQQFEETVNMLDELDAAFRQFDNLAFGPRRSIGSSPGRPAKLDVLAPDLLAAILCQQLWLLRDDMGDAFSAILEKFLSLSYSRRAKAEENALMAKLTLHGVYGRFRADMFLSSLTESTIAVPMGMANKKKDTQATSSMEIAEALSNTEKLLWTQLQVSATTGSVIKVREAILSLVLIAAFRTSLGDRRPELPTIMTSLLDMSAALSLRRDMLDAIDHKFPPTAADDLEWPLMSADGTALPRTTPSLVKRTRMLSLSDSEDDEDETRSSDVPLKNYWAGVRAKYEALVLDPASLSVSETATLPRNWTVVNISVSPDRSALFCSRRECGNEDSQPLIFCIPLRGRRDHGEVDEEDEHLTFEGAIQELQDIVRSSDECTKSAIHIKADDEEARANWWKLRSQLDIRMRELMENIEFCWLGAFKSALGARSNISSEAVEEFRSQLERVFHRSLHIKEKKTRKTHSHKKSASQVQTNAPTQFTLDDSIIRCFSTLSPKCKDEELEDIAYFVLDLYQFHGVPVAIAEVDMDQVVVDIRTVLEEHNVRQAKQNGADKLAKTGDNEHIFLVLDKNVQGLPWESMPILRGRSVSRIPGVQFLHDRLEFAKCKREAAGQEYGTTEGAIVDPRKGYYILNPSGDLGRTEERFQDWVNGVKNVGWQGTAGKPVSEQQFVQALQTQDIVVYFGHGGGEQYIRSQKIRTLPRCAATMLWGCSSGFLRDMGDFDRTGTPYNYMLGGCPTLVANLWDVTDKDIDKFSQAVFDKLSLSGKSISERSEKPSTNPTSVVTAVAQSRDACKLKYLTGAAPVVYGIPFYL